MKQVLGFLRRADEDHGMIRNGETLAVGVSGGKDSMALLYALHLYKNFAKSSFLLHAFTVDLGFEGFDSGTISDYCKSLGIPFTLIKTHIYDIVFNQRKEKNPCALCAKMRKGTLFTQIIRQGLTTCAFAHHREDCLESLLLSMLFEGRMRTFCPVTYLDRMGVKLVRPFICLPEKEISAAVNRHTIPVVKNPCPAVQSSKREHTKRLLAQICENSPDAREKMMSAIKNVSQYSLWS